MTNRLRLPAGVWADRGRLARVFDEAVFELLEPALVEAGIDSSAEVCLRRVDAHIRLHMRGTDHAVARAWSRALAEAIRRAAGGTHPSLICYRSRGRALEDVASSALRHDLTRAWAWRQLGLWTLPDHAGAREA